MPLKPAMSRRLRLRTVLLLLAMLVLAVPLGGIYVFHIYENELVRQTEGELIGQGAYAAALYSHAVATLAQGDDSYGLPDPVPPIAESPVSRVVEPVLNLSDATILPPRPDAELARNAPDPLALEAGRGVSPILDAATLVTLAGVRVVDFHGVVVAGRGETGRSLAAVPEVATALQGRYAAVLRRRISDHPSPALNSLSREPDIRVFVAMPVVNGNRIVGAVLVSRSPRNLARALYDDRYPVIVAALLIVGITGLLGIAASLAIARPIQALTRQAQRIGTGERDILPLRHPITREVDELSRNLSRMGAALAERSDYIRNFAMHVSHEFKTPLAAIRGAIELIQEHGSAMSPGQMERFLDNTARDTERLGRLVTRLLELARADVSLPVGEICDPAGVIAELRGSHGAGVRIAFESPAVPVQIPMPADMLRTILGNLIENSFQHGATSVWLAVDDAEPNTSISVRDDGRGISPANAGNLFTPFFTTRRESGGTGLGLAIVRSMLAAYDASIRHDPTDQGAGFTISIPKPGASAREHASAGTASAAPS